MGIGRSSIWRMWIEHNRLIGTYKSEFLTYSRFEQLRNVMMFSIDARLDVFEELNSRDEFIILNTPRSKDILAKRWKVGFTYSPGDTLVYLNILSIGKIYNYLIDSQLDQETFNLVVERGNFFILFKNEVDVVKMKLVI